MTCFHFVVDGHHKLKKWGFVVHAGIDDGYSQIITYMCCATDNRANTVYRLFVTAVKQYGLPHVFAVIREERMLELLSI